MSSLVAISQPSRWGLEKSWHWGQQFVRRTVDRCRVNDNVPAQRRPLLTPEDLSTYLGGIPVRTLDRWRSQRTGPSFIRVGRYVRYRPEDVDLWLAERLRDADEWMCS